MRFLIFKNILKLLFIELNEYLDDDWDRQMQTDLAGGKLDKFITKVESEIEANQVRDKINCPNLCFDSCSSILSSHFE